MKTKNYLLKGGLVGFCTSILVILLSYILPGVSCPNYFIIGGSRETNSFCELLFSNPLYSHYPFPRIVGEWIGTVVIIILLGVIIGWIYGKFKNRNSNKDMNPVRD